MKESNEKGAPESGVHPKEYRTSIIGGQQFHLNGNPRYRKTRQEKEDTATPQEDEDDANAENLDAS